MEFADWLAAWPGAAALRENGTLYLFVNAAHILGIALLLGAILPLDLAILGFVRAPPLAVLAPHASRVAGFGAALAILTGVTLLAVRPREYLANPAFLVKAALLALAFANIALQHLLPGWRRLRAGEAPSAMVRALAAASAVLWLSVLVAGRWIGFL